ncbi:S8 family peptidase [Hyphococcus sp.]|uniref:S8 family peptidase n=1 Tax=Hyphococcus sp. TaxID=2038636 RepID=UPI003D103171
MLSLGLAACGGGGGGAVPSPMTPAPAPPPPPAPAPVNYDTAEYRNQPALDRIGAIAAYERDAQGAGVIISVIDTGIDDDHPEFLGRIHPQSADLLIAGVVAPGDVRAGGPDLFDYDDHGTPVASIIAAARNGAGIHGVAPEATLLIYRVDDDSMDDNSLLGNAIGEAVSRSASLSAGVVNMSFGTDEPAARPQFAGDFTTLKNADVVAVVAAGNDGDANPDESALGALDVAGEPNVIIAGSVDAANNISSFSDRAGIAADIYLVAPGEFLRGVVPNGTASQTRSFSGTSAATPVITGAVALVRSLWPALDAETVVEILLATATDLGAPGTDPIYGRGLLNLAAATSPMNGVSTSSISGSEVDPAAMGGTLSGVYGSSLSELGDIVVLDGYGRDFRLSLSSLVAQSAPDSFDLESRYSPFDQHRYSAMTLDRNWSLQMRLTSRDRSQRSLIDHQIAFGGASSRSDARAEESIGFAFSGAINEETHLIAAQGFSAAAVDRMAVPSRATPFLSDSAFNDAYLPRSADAVTSMMQFSPAKNITADLMMTAGGDRDLTLETALYDDGLPMDNPDVFVLRGGVNVAFGDTILRFEQGMRQEQGGVFNARFGGDMNATTVYSAIEGVWSPAPLWRLQGRIAAGLTFADAFGFEAFAENAPVLKTTQFSAAVSRQKLFGEADALWLGVSQPLQIEAGALELMLPTAYDPYTEEFFYSPVTASLAAAGRRLDFEAGYRLFSDESGVIDVNLMHQTFGGYDLDAQTTALLRGRFDF